MLTKEQIERIETSLHRKLYLNRADNVFGVKRVDRYEPHTAVWWPGIAEGRVRRSRESKGWYWTVEHLGRDEFLLASGEARTKREAVDDMVDAFIREVSEGASRRDVFSAWMART